MDDAVWRRGEYEVSTNSLRLDLDVIHEFLATSYWASGVSRETVERSCQGSLCFGLYRGDDQIGFARVVTDCATMAWLADVFVLETERGAGLGKWLVGCIVDHPQLQGLRRWMLGTQDAHGLYERYGFKPIARPERLMERRGPEADGGNAGGEP